MRVTQLNKTLEFVFTKKNDFECWLDLMPEISSVNNDRRPAGNFEFVTLREQHMLGLWSDIYSSLEDSAEKKLFDVYRSIINNSQKELPHEKKIALLPQCNVLDGYRVDFMFFNRKISDEICVIEVDGRTHYEPYEFESSQDKDFQRMEAFTRHTARDRELRKYFTVFRFTAMEVEHPDFIFLLKATLGI